MNTKTITHRFDTQYVINGTGFILHGIPIDGNGPAKAECISAWFNAEGELEDCEFSPTAQRVPARMHKYLQQRGTRYKWMRDKNMIPSV